MRNWVGKRRVELPKRKGTQNWTFGNCIASIGYPDEELGGQEKSRTTQEQGNTKLDFWKLESALQGYPYKELGGQEKSRTTQEQGNSKLDFWKLETALQFSFNYNLIFVLSLAFNLTNLKSRGYPNEELGGQEKSRTTQEQGNSKFDFWKLETALQFSFNYNLIFVLSLAFNLTNLKSRGYPNEELGGQEKSRTTQEQGNSKFDFWKLETALHFYFYL
ncbi:unnamed protein product [Prunus armeniaca]